MGVVRSAYLSALVASPWIQRGLITAFLIVIYWNSLWDAVPRADQLIYLHQIGRFHSLWNIWLTAPSWNRTESAGDFILFRPLLYLLLGTFYYFFHYKFALWQWAALTMHICVVMGLYTLFVRGALRSTCYPFLLAMLFGGAFVGSEMVLWSNVVGYLLFAALFVFSVNFLVQFLDTRRGHCLWLAWFLAVLSEFTYEIGVVFNLLIALTFVSVFLYDRFKNVEWKGESRRRYDLMIALLFLGSAILYPILSVADLWYLRLPIPPMPASGSNFIHSLGLAAYYAIAQLRFWFVGWLFPTAYNIGAFGRATFTGFNFHSVPFILNALAVSVEAYAILRLVKLTGAMSHAKSPRVWTTPCLTVLFLVAYSLIIAWGRGVPRGLHYVLFINLYYAYTAYLIFAVGLGLFFHFYEFSVGARGRVRSGSSSAAFRSSLVRMRAPLYSLRITLPLVLSVLVFANGYAVFRLCSQYRYSYSAPIHALVVSVSHWIKIHEKDKQAYFKVGPGCPGDAPLPWFGQSDLRKGSGWVPPVTTADALWPEKSYRLNSKKLAEQKSFISEITCSSVSASTDPTPR